MSVFHGLIRSSRRTVNRWRRQVKDRPIPGLPPGLSFDTASDACLLRTGHSLLKAWHTPLSRWKSTCNTYRVTLEPRNGRRWTLIYKDANYRRGQSAALEGIPVTPGPPEYLIYAKPPEPLKRFLPTVYLVRQIVPGEHYQYLLEDLGGAYQKSTHADGILRAGDLLPTLLESMSQWEKPAGQEGLLQYDQAFHHGLLEYVRVSLERYSTLVEMPALDDFCKIWPEISSTYSQLPVDMRGLQPIHGDFNISNVLFHKQDPSRIKILDWEWAGMGLPQADLASLLKPARPEVEAKVLENYSERNKEHSAREHYRLFQWCKLQRELFDTAFTARQVIENPVSPGFDRHHFIEMSLRRALRAYQALQLP